MLVKIQRGEMSHLCFIHIFQVNKYSTDDIIIDFPHIKDYSNQLIIHKIPLHIVINGQLGHEYGELNN